jgi:hypothetical protein
VENIAGQIYVKGVSAVAMMNRAASPILAYSTSSKLDVVVPQHEFQGHAPLDRFEIQPVDHGRTSKWMPPPAEQVCRSISVSDLRPSTNSRAISLRHCLTRRWRVRSCPGGNVPGVLSCKRMNSSLALAPVVR